MYSNNPSNPELYEPSKKSIQKLQSTIEELKSANAQLKARNIMHKEFINIAAHELRTPIQPILSLAKVLQSRIKDSEQSDLLNAVIKNAKRLQRLTEDILDVTKMENSSLKLNKELFNLYHLLSSNVEDYKSQIEKDNVSIELLLEPTNEDLLIEADRNRLSQVISNLLSNAIKFTNEGTVSVAVQMKDSSRVIVSVKDTGTGIDPEILPRLFCKFATISKTGTGLGLFISKNIIEAHGGNIYAENNEGIEGATFYIILPVHSEGDFSTVDELHKITDPGPEYGESKLNF
jgi:signal transduction histidine kinase